MSMRVHTSKQKHQHTTQEGQPRSGPSAALRKRAGRGLRLTAKSFFAISMISGVLLAAIGRAPVMAAACSAATADLGTDTISVNIPADGTYTVWTRMTAASATANSINLQIDSTDCYSVGGGSFAQTSWVDSPANWVNYANGTPSTPVTKALTAGAHTLKYIGTQDGVSIDTVLVTSDTTCAPTGTTGCPGGGGGTPPTVNIVQPTGGTVQGDVDISATATTAINEMDFYVDNKLVGKDTTSPYAFTWNSAGVPNGTHSLTAKGIDAAGLTGTSAAVSVTSNNSVVCTGVPQAPANLKVKGTTASSVTLAWDAATPATSCNIVAYKVYRDDVLVTSVPLATEYADTGLTPGSSHTYTVVAVDSSDHESVKSAPVTGKPEADTQAPTVPMNLKTTLATSSSIAIAWDASTDNNAVASYTIMQNGTQVGTSNTNSYTATGLTPNTAYSFTVKALDSSGNASAESAAFSASTIDGPGGGGTAGPATMYLNPTTGSFATGGVIYVAIRVDTAGKAINAAGADLTYSSNLEYQYVENSPELNTCPTKSGGSGKVSIECFMLPSGDAPVSITGDKLIATVAFKILATGTATISIDNTAQALSADDSSNVVGKLRGASYALVNPPSPNPNPNPTPNPNPRPNGGGGGGGGGTVTPRPSTTGTTTTVTPQGNTTPVVVPDNSTVELSDPAVVQTNSDGSSDIKKVEYYLNGKLIATVNDPPFSYSVNTKSLRNGKYTLTTKTYYQNGKTETSSVALVVKNPMNFTQIMLQLKHYAWLLILFFIIIAGVIWYMFFRGNGGEDPYADDGYGTYTPDGTDGTQPPYDGTGGYGDGTAGQGTPPAAPPTYGSPYPQ